MMPGVTYLPAPSMTVAPVGTVTIGPSATIFPSAMEIIPLRIVGPAAVMMFTLRMTSGGEGKRAYVLGNGLAFGVETPPSPVAAAESFGVTGGLVDFLGAHAEPTMSASARMK